MILNFTFYLPSINFLQTYLSNILSEMQQTAQELRDLLWGKLKVVCEPYFQDKGELKIQTVEEIIVEVLKEESQNQVDYVMKNIFRLDVDGSGTVSFIELGNFLFKRHCGQLSLQRDHKSGKMSKGPQRIMNLQEFNRLINTAYKFLGVVCPPEVASYIFQSVDADKDGYITYVEYFKVIELYVCKSDKPIPPAQPPQPQGKERHSKLRIYLWDELRRLYDAYVQGRSLEASDAGLRSLVFAIVGQLSQLELNFLAAGLLQLNYQLINFESFTIHLIYLITELGLSRYSRNNSISKKTLNRDEFVIVLRNTFKFAKLDKFKVSILYKIFAKIDKNIDGLISFEEYLDWVKRFLAVLKYFGDEFYVLEDDNQLDSSDPTETIVPAPQPIDKNKVSFVFSDYSFAKQVRARVLELLIPYDVDKNQQFSQKEIHAALIGLLKENELQLVYVTKNVFRYDKDNNNKVTYDELTNFCVEQHFGQMAIQRLHRTSFYSKGAERIMNKQQFGKTLNIALSFINLEASPAIIDLLFSEIDLDHDGWITYVVYFLFLRYYFGSCSLITTSEYKVKGPSQYEKLLEQYKGLSSWDRFVRMIVDQLRIIFFRYDSNKNQVFELEQIQEILLKVFNLSQQQLEYVLFTYFKFLKSQNDNVSFQQLIAIILSIYFIEIVFHRRYQSKDNQIWKSRKISLDEFISLINDACYFISYRPLREDLIFIFNELDTDKDGFITFQQYAEFIRKYLGNGINLFVKPPPINVPPNISEEEYGFVNAIWDELKVYFDRYDQGTKGFLNEAELKKFVIEVLNETTQKELNYVFWNLFRVDSNLNKEVEFLQFAPFILNHAGEISLQRFHKEQTKGKNTLNDEQIYIVLTNAYRFLSSYPKKKPAITNIFLRIATNGSVTYAGFLNWIHHALAAKYNKK